MNKKKNKKNKTVKDAIGDLPKIFPIKQNGKISHLNLNFQNILQGFIMKEI